MNRCRHGVYEVDCRRCTRYGSLPAPLTIPAPPAKAHRPARRVTTVRSSDTKPRERHVPDHLFVCQDCYQAFRNHRHIIPTHLACLARLRARKKELPLTA